MQAANPEANSAVNSAFESAKNAAREIVQSLPPDSQCCVISSGGRAIVQSAGTTSDKRRIVEAIERTPPGAGPGESKEAIRAAIQQLNQIPLASKRIVLISDFQSNEWSSQSAEDLSELRNLCDNSSPRVRLSLLPISNKSENLWSIDSLELSDTLLTPGFPISIRATVTNFADRSFQQLNVCLQVNGHPISQQWIDLPSKASQSIVFTAQLDEVGSHSVTVACKATEAEIQDQVLTDNQRSHSVMVAQPMNVVILDRQPESQALKTPSGYLRTALLSSSEISQSSLLQVQTIDPRALTAELAQSAVAIVLANITRVENQQLQLLSDFLDRGGLVMVVPGDEIDRNWYNDQLGAKGKNWLPMQISEAVTQQSSEKNLTIRLQSFQHPGLTWLNDSDGSLISSIEWQRYFKLIEADSVTTPLLSLSNDSPLLVERSVGSGKLLLWASALEEKWSNIVVRPVFVPMMQQLALQHAAAQLPRVNLSTSDTLQLRAAENKSPSKRKPSQSNVKLIAPNQRQFSIELAERDNASLLNWNDFTQPGAYRFERLPSELLPGWLKLKASANNSKANAANDLQISVNSPSFESKMGWLSAEQLQQLAKQLGANLTDSASAFASNERLEREGYEIFRWLLWGLLIFLFAELWLQRLISRKLA